MARAAPKNRAWHISEAIHSYRRLVQIVDELTENEVYAALALECDSQRRKSIVNRLIAKAADFNRQKFITHLKEKFNVTPEIRRPVRR